MKDFRKNKKELDSNYETVILNWKLILIWNYSQSGYMCMIFYRRDTHIAEIQMGMPAVRLEDACTVDNFDVMKLPYVTLVGTFKWILEMLWNVQ